MSKVYQKGREQDPKGDILQFFSFLTSSKKGLDFSDQWMFVVEATKTSRGKKISLEIHYTV